MWLYTKIGFFSIRKDEKIPDCYHIRTRSAAHQTALLALAEPWPDGLPVAHSTPSADYPYRIVCSGANFCHVMDCLAETVDYTNFKAAVDAATRDPKVRDREIDAYRAAVHEVYLATLRNS